MMARVTRGWGRWAFLLLGWFFVGLGVLGLFLPLLPTTPFLLLASSCFVRSSPRWQRWLMNSRWFGPTLRDWDEHRAVRRPVKVLAVVVVSIVLVFAAVRDLHWLVRTLIIVLGLVGLAVVYRLPVVPAAGGDRAEPATGEDAKA
jgi:uncharacterized protein